MSKEPIVDEFMVHPVCQQAAEEAWSRRKVGPVFASDKFMDADNPFRDLSDGAVRRIEKAMRDLPGLADPDKRADAKCLSAARQVMAFRQLKSID